IERRNTAGSILTFLFVVRMIKPSYCSMITVTFPPFKPQQCYDLFVKIMNDMGVTVDSKVKLKELMSVLGANGRQIKNIINNAVLSASEGNVPLSDIVIAAKDLSKAIKIELNK
ncbi:MAG: hypothetical protein AAFN93_27335, partial [Bacteroidota bacterium]